MNERLRILELIESGQISVEEGLRRLEGLNHGDGDETEIEAEAAPAPAAGAGEPSAERVVAPLVRVVWQIVFGLGVAVMAGGGLLLSRAYGREGTPGLAWGWALFALGVVVMALGWWLRRARWFYLRVREHGGPAFTIALPLPLGVVIGLLRVAKPFVPQLQEMEADTLVLAMRDELRNGQPLTIRVDEGEDGDRVELYFG